MLLSNAEGRNQAIDRLAHSVAASSKRPAVARGLTGEISAGHVEHLQLQQLTLDSFGGDVIANALKNLAENQVSEAETLTLQLRMNPIGFGR